VVTILNLIEVRQQSQPEQDSFHEWILPNGTQWASFHRLENEYLIRFTDLADFTLSRDGLDVAAYPVPKVSNQTVERLYLNLVIPLALSRQFKLVLHGSAVELGNSAVAFLAKSGGGKSTLAASFSTSGFRFLTDDNLLLDDVDSQYFVQPTHPSIRLWDDSREALMPDATCSSSPVDYSSKARLLANEHIAHCDNALPLKYVYFLSQSSTDKVSITAVSGRDAIIELHKHSFLLDMEEREMITQHFQQISALADHPIFFRLEYPHSYERLLNVHESVVKHVHEGSFP